MNRVLLTCLLVFMGGCSGETDRSDDAARVRRTARNCAGRLIDEARKWYDGLQPKLSDERFSAEVQVMLAAAGWVHTYEVVLDPQGIPVDITWDQSFWDASSLVLDRDELKSWKVWSVDVLDSVRVATGIVAPASWRSAVALPTARSVADASGVPLEAAIASLEQFIPVSRQGAVTPQLRAIMPTFPASDLFASPPSEQ